jgi:hypothetical protein
MRTLVVIALLAGLAANGGGPQGRPHLEVLSDIPESQLFMTMNAVAASLGVGCDYCHVRKAADPTTVVGGWLFDRDDKPAKAKGREMMRMVREINASRYEGRPVVTCFTCHRGETRVVGTPPLPPSEAPASRTAAVALPSTKDLLERYIAAVGGADAATRFATTVMQARDERSEGRRGEVTISLKGVDRFRVDLRLASQPAIAQGFAGAAGWVTVGGKSQSLPAADLARLRRQAARYMPLKIVDSADTLRVDRVESIRGRETYAAIVVVDPNIIRTYFFDVASGLLLRESVTTATRFLPLQEQVDYDDYRRVDGIMWPFLVRQSTDAPYDTSTKTFTSITHGVPLEDAWFVIPRGGSL